MQKINFKTVDEITKEQVYYAMIEFSIADKRSYSMIVDDGALVIEWLCDDFDKAYEMFTLLHNGNAGSFNLDEVVRDIRVEFFA